MTNLDSKVIANGPIAMPPPIQPLLEPTPLSRPAPVAEFERIHAIDTLRGVALLGILLLNIQSFAMPGAAYMNPTAYGNLSGANYWVWYFTHLLAEQKFMTIFSMLFGAGIVLMTSRNESTGRSSAGIHYARMGWLILFGLLHAHLLWYGDILYFYGMCGLAAWLFRKWSPAILIPLGLVIVGVASAITLLGGWSTQFWGAEGIDAYQLEWSGSSQTAAEELAAYRGNWLEQMPQRVSGALVFETFMFAIWGGWRAGGLMLIGMGMYKLGIFSARASARTYWSMILAGLLVGIPAIAWGIRKNFDADWHFGYSLFFGSQYNYWASILVSLGWVGAVMLAYRSGAFDWAMRPIAAVGRMALTNYLLQTFICTTIFYGHGLGYFGSVERIGQLAIVFGVWAFQLTFSNLWLRHFQFGPAEWLWRTLTYLKVQPLRRKNPPAGVAELQTG